MGQSQAYAAVVLNEIFPVTEQASQQWIEVYNTGSESVSLDRWKLQNTTGEVKTFMMNASFIIPGHGFIVFPQTQTSVTLTLAGDTVRLLNENDTLVDSQSYPSTLGYNTAIGRSPDGAEGWSICSPSPYTATPGKANNCSPPPSPTPTPTVTPTLSPTLTVTPTSVPVPSAAATISPTPPAAPTLVETDEKISTPAPIGFMQSKKYRYMWVAGIGIGVLLAIIVVIVGRNHKKKKIVLHI